MMKNNMSSNSLFFDKDAEDKLTDKIANRGNEYQILLKQYNKLDRVHNHTKY